MKNDNYSKPQDIFEMISLIAKPSIFNYLLLTLSFIFCLSFFYLVGLGIFISCSGALILLYLFWFVEICKITISGNKLHYRFVYSVFTKRKSFSLNDIIRLEVCNNHKISKLGHMNVKYKTKGLIKNSYFAFSSFDDFEFNLFVTQLERFGVDTFLGDDCF